MGTQAAVRELLAERGRIDRALAALNQQPVRSTPPPSGPGPRKPQTKSASASSAQGKGKRTFKMSEAAKEKIRQAQRARWAKIKKSMSPAPQGKRAA